MPPISVEEEFQVKFVLGPWLIGSSLELLLMGILSCQFVNYYNWYPDDSRGIRIAVAILCLLNVLKSAESFAALWIFLINHFGDLQYDMQLSVTGWWDTSNPLLVAILSFYVQCYFCYRLWSVSKKWWVVAPILILFIFALLSMVIGTYYIATFDFDQLLHILVLYSVIGISPRVEFLLVHNYPQPSAGDVILTVTTAYFLVKTKKNLINPRTVGLINALIRLAFQTAAPAALFAMLTLISSQLHHRDPLYGYIEIAFNQPLPKLYAISMMWTLNARRAIRSRNGLSGNNSYEPSGEPVRSPRRTNEDVELGRVEVLTKTQTTQHVNVTDMFRHTNTNEDGIHSLSDPDHKIASESTD
ncbi:hypothetical protein MVEN_02338300 [Mycena venus]|uniref:DUF6534 domain-containing protein n=1 Tax=Mycena venus TaxID=2733690 RepID=A0A8H6X4E2_9AGAR|nr:hypothetical protein MVEN_02338300 [Mycena venus]